MKLIHPNLKQQLESIKRNKRRIKNRQQKHNKLLNR